MEAKVGTEVRRRASGRITSPTFVGRAEELSALEGALQGLADRPASTILLAGEAGVGKTRLAVEFGRRARESGARVLRGSCLELGSGGIPFAPFAEALREAWREAGPEELGPILGPARAELSRLVPELSSGDDDRSEPALSASSTGRLFELTLGFLDRLSAASPVVLVVEDLHWADAASRDLLVFLVRNARQRLLIVATFRSDTVHRRHPLAPVLAELERAERVERIDLARFNADELRAMLEGILGERPGRDLTESVYLRSGGNAFFAEELVAARDSAAGLPPALRDLILVRVETLEARTQTMLRAAAVIGPHFDESTLRDVAGLPDPELFDALRDAVGQHLVEPADDDGASTYRFRHALVQEAIYLDQLPGERARLHAEAARSLSAGLSEDPAGRTDAARAAEIAHHWDAARDQPRALASAVVAGRAATSVYAFGDALEHFESAQALWDRVPNAEALAGTTRLDLLEAAADAAWLAGDGRRAVTLVRSAIDAVDSLTDAPRAGRLEERLGQYLWDAGDETGAGVAYEHAARLIPETPPSASRARVLATRAQMLMLAGRYVDSARAAREAIDVARRADAPAVEGHARCTLGVDLAYTGDIDHGIEELRAARGLAEQPVRPDDLGRAILNLGLVLWRAGRLEESTRVSLDGQAVARNLGMARTLGRSMATNAAITLFYQGRWTEAAGLAEEELDADAQGLVRIHLLLTRAQVAIGRGAWSQASLDLDEVAALVEPVAHAQLIGDLHALRAEHALWRGDPGGATGSVDDGLRLLGPTDDAILQARLCALGMRAAADRSELARARRSQDEIRAARAAGDVLLERAEGIGRAPEHDSFEDRQPHAYVLLARAERSRLEAAPDPGAWRAAADAWQQIGVPFPAAYAAWREAEALLAQRSGARSEAEGPLRVARDHAVALGSEPLLREVTALARRARIELDVAAQPAPAPTRPPEVERLGLTERELEVLALVAIGRTNRQIAETLFITEKTAGAHVSNILGKLGVAGRVEAAGIALRLGLVEDQDRDAGS